MPVADDENALAWRMWRRLVAARRRSPNMGLRTATSALLAMRATAEPFSAGLACYGLAAI